LFLYNFTPWTWAFRRPQWFPALEPALAPWVGAGCAVLGAAAFVAVAWLSLRSHREASPRASVLAPTVVCLGMTLAANLPFAAVHLSEWFVRTHLSSRVWAALALAGLAELRPRRASTGRAWTVAAAAAFVGLGVWGGVERQDYFLGYSRLHRQELASILRQVPGLAPQAALILHAPPHRRLLAIDAPYLARAWMTLLYQDPSVECRVFLWSPGAGSTCEARDEGFLCRSEISPRCVPPGEPRQQRFAYSRVLMLTYEEATNAWVPAPAASSPPLPVAGGLVLAREPSALARDLIGAPEGDGR
jgi:hypothetical protein